jgi:AcrR family transcriptional regulator
MAEIGLRERKKQRTRQAIVDAALRLFDERGFEQTTIADIAEAADIAPRTFFGYFPSKEDVVFDEFPEIYDELARRLRERPESETAIDALRGWLLGFFQSTDFSDERHQCRHRVIEQSEALQARERAVRGRMQDLLAESMARDLGDEPGDLRPRLAAAAAMSAFEAAVGQELKENPPADPAEAAAVIDQAVAFLQGGLAELRKA